MTECICKLKKNRFNKLFETTEDFNSFKECVSYFCNFTAIKNNNLTSFLVSPDYMLDIDDWFYLEVDKLETNIKRHVDKIYEHFRGNADLSNIDSTTLKDVELVMYGEEIESKLKINFQVISKSKFITEDKRFLFFENGTKILKNENLIQFENKIDFIFCEKMNKIYFKKLSHLNYIHGDFKHLYKEASQSDLKIIFTEELIDLIDIDDTLIENNKISSLNLKKVSFCNKNGVFDEIKEQEEEFLGYMNKYSPLQELILQDEDLTKYPELNKLLIEGKSLDEIKLSPELNKVVKTKVMKISIKTNENMSTFLKACNEQAYEGDFTGEYFFSNSNKKIKR